MKRARAACTSDMPLRVPITCTPEDEGSPSPSYVADREIRRDADGTTMMPPPSPVPSRAPLSALHNVTSGADLNYRSPTAKRLRHRTSSGIDGQCAISSGSARDSLLVGGALRVITPTKRGALRSRVSWESRGRARGSSVSSRSSSESTEKFTDSTCHGGGKRGKDGGSVGGTNEAGTEHTASGGNGHEYGKSGGFEAPRTNGRQSASNSMSSHLTVSATSSSSSDSTPSPVLGAVSSSFPIATTLVTVDEGAARRVGAKRSGSYFKPRTRADSSAEKEVKRSRDHHDAGTSQSSSCNGQLDPAECCTRDNDTVRTSSNQQSSASAFGGASASKKARRSSLSALRVDGACEECGGSEATVGTDGAGNVGLCEDCAAEAKLAMEERPRELVKRRSTMASMRLRRQSAVTSSIARGTPSDAASERRDLSRQPARDDFEGGKALGKGKFGNVYLVKYKSTGATVALKVLFKGSVVGDGMRHSVQREAEVQSKLRHPNIVRMMGFFQDPTKVHFVLEYAPGGDVFKVLRQYRKGLPKDMAARFILGAARAVAYLHRRHVIHRDIKPENLLLDAAGRVKLSDFGWSVPAVPPRYHVRTTLCGTPEYVAPEMLVEAPRYTNAVDVWSLGVLCFELLAGVTPFRDRVVQSSDPPLENAESVKEAAEVRPGDVNAELYGRIVSWNGCLEGLFGKGTAGSGIPEEVKVVVSSLMRPRASDRISTEEALRLPWLEVAAQGDAVV